MAASSKRIINVDNGPGTNGLRGGVKEYNPKTATGAWMETYGGPIGYKRGFTNSEFETEAQHAQLGALPKPLGFYGAGIPLVDLRDSNGNDTSSAKTDARMWTTTSREVHKNLGTIRKDDEQYVLLKPRLSREKLVEYRNQWTSDKKANRKIRFQTESQLAGSFASQRFRHTALRLLPGTPKSLEDYRKRVVERYGLFGVSALRFHVGLRSMSCADFRSRIRNVGVDVKPHELSQIMAYITPSGVLLTDKEAEDFFLVIKGHREGFSSSSVSHLFFTLCNDSSEGALLPLSSLLILLDTDKHPDLMAGFTTFLPAYCSTDSLSLDQFIELHDDLYASSPDSFEELVTSVWRLD